MNDGEVLERIIAIEKKVEEALNMAREHRVMIEGDQDRRGLSDRLEKLEDRVSMHIDKTCKAINQINDTLTKISEALLGRMNGNRKEPGLIAIVEQNSQLLSNVKRFVWALLGVLIGLGVMQVWNAITHAITDSGGILP